MDNRISWSGSGAAGWCRPPISRTAAGIQMLSVDHSSGEVGFGDDLLDVKLAAKIRAGCQILIVDDINRLRAAPSRYLRTARSGRRAPIPAGPARRAVLGPQCPLEGAGRIYLRLGDRPRPGQELVACLPVGKPSRPARPCKIEALAVAGSGSPSAAWSAEAHLAGPAPGRSPDLLLLLRRLRRSGGGAAFARSRDARCQPPRAVIRRPVSPWPRALG